MQCIQEKKN